MRATYHFTGLFPNGETVIDRSLVASRGHALLFALVAGDVPKMQARNGRPVVRVECKCATSLSGGRSLAVVAPWLV
jgi:hypothetical protein